MPVTGATVIDGHLITQNADGTTDDHGSNVVDGGVGGFNDDVQVLVDEAVADLVNSAPGTLNTLGEVASALGNDPNLATTLTGLIGAKETPAGAQTKVDTHVNDSSDAHAGTAITFAPSGLTVITGVTTVQAALAKIDALFGANDGFATLGPTGIVVQNPKIHGARHILTDPLLAEGLHSARPSANAATAPFWLSTDLNGGTLFRSNNTTWLQLACGVLGAAGVEVGSVEVTSSQGFTSASLVDATGLTFTVPAIAQPIVVEFGPVYVTHSVAGNYSGMSIVEDGVVKGTIYMDHLTTAAKGGPVSIKVRRPASGSSRVYKMQGFRGGSGTATWNMDSGAAFTTGLFIATSR